MFSLDDAVETLGGSSELITVFVQLDPYQLSSGTYLRNVMTVVFIVCLLLRHLQLH